MTFTSAYAQTVSNEVPMQFGNMVVGGAGTVTVLNTSDTRNATGAVALVGSAPVQRASFDITFTPGSQVVITLPGPTTMAGANTPSFTPTILGGTTQTIPGGGILTVFLGGTITFTLSGSYGVASVTVPVIVDPL